MKVPTYPQGHKLLDGKRVIVTAAAGTGIGFALAKRCIEEGARVLISDIHERRLGEAVERLSALAELGGRRPAAVLCNVAVQGDVDRLFAAAESELGGLDVVMNNAGLGGTATLVDMTDDQWAKVMDVSLTGTFRMTRAALQKMIPQGTGAIVNNASVLGWRAQAGQAHYAAAKAGVMALTRCAAMEAAPHGVRVNAVAPSLAMHAFLAKVTTPELLDELTAREALGRAAEPWEVANVMVFLASDYASYMTGEVVAVSSQHALPTQEHFPMVDKGAEGAAGEPFEMDVERGKIYELARAVKAEHPAYFDRAPVAPPTFLTTTFLWESLVPGSNPWERVAMDQRRGMHAEQEYIFYGPPPRAGARLTCRSRIESIFEKVGKRGGKMVFAVMVTDFHDEQGKLVATARMTGVETERPPEETPR